MSLRALALLAGAAGIASCTTYDRTVDAKPPVPTVEVKEAEPEPEPKLVVLLVVDQLPAWSFDDAEPHLSGGLARLLREGTQLTGRYPYAATLTAPGHATLGTGVPPHQSGVFVNKRYDRQRAKVVSSVDDPTSDTHVLTGDAPSRRAGGASSWQLDVDGTADALRVGSQGLGKSVGISIKDRAAILPLGRRPDLAIWYDAKQPAMTTSTFYAAEPPAWLASLARTSPISEQLNEVWTPLDPSKLEEVALDVDAAAGETSYGGLGPTFPHAIGQSKLPAFAYGFTPASNAMLIETALAAIDGEGLGEDDVPDVLSISFSAHDKAGHLWGQESWERTEILLRLDEQLGEFFSELDARVGTDNWAVVLTADHGAAPRVERSAKHWEARRIPTKQIKEVANAAASRSARRRGVDRPRRGHDALARRCRPKAPRPGAGAGRRRHGRRGGAARGNRLRLADLAGRRRLRRAPELLGLVCRSLPPDLAGDLYYVPRSHSVIGSEHGTTHGTPHLYDRDVPIVIRAPWADTPLPNGPVSMLRVAPTLARLLGVKPPRTARGKPLVETDDD